MNLFVRSFSACLLATAVPAGAGVVVQGQNSTTSLAYAGAASATDLINAGQTSLAAATVTPSHSAFPGGGINDGVYANSSLPANTFFQPDVHFPATATYELNLAGAPNGYDLASIDSFMGWYSVTPRQANQTYTVEVSTVGSSGFRPLAHVNYAPFSATGSYDYETRVTITEDTAGALAANVDAIRFIFADPGNTGATPGTLVREIDVQGAPSATTPPTVAVQTVTDFSEVDEAYAGEVVNNDLVNTGQATLASFTTSTTPAFGVGGQNDGTSGLANTTAAAWYQPAQMPATLTFELNPAAATDGYAITTIRTFAGWKNGGTQTYANQKYSIEYRTVGSSDWLPLESVDYSPFSSLVNTPASTRVVLSKPGGNLLSGVVALRFVFQVPTRADGASNGTVLQEIDVLGYPEGDPPGPIVSVSNPTQRQIVQRTAANTASIPITGTYTGTPDRIEARAVVMDGATNSGTSTDWTTLVAAPSGGAFSGTLANVAAGGWYQIEVRSMTAETPSPTAVREKVGVGDIYITAGQSNSTNYGSPALTPADDRVVVRTGLAGNSWRHGYDPMPAPDGSTGGSVWSRLGGLLAAADNIPVGFLCAGWGATATSQWVPGTSNYTNLKTGIQSFPANGFRAVLWHQGESDSLASTTPANYQSRMQSIVTQSRTDGGWTVPWYLAEVGFHPGSTLAQEEPVVAGQRRAIHADAQVFPGPVTDDFHLEAKLSDTVHFNAAGLADHAAQWAEVLGGSAPLAPKNGDFESNTALVDGGIATINTGAVSSPSVIGWRALAASGEAVADGSCGYYNPNDSFYPGAADGGGGVLPNMSGKHVAFLSGSAAGAHFLQTRRAMLGATRTYTLTVALGVRGNADTFGGAVLAILADGAVIGSRTVTLADLNALNAGNAAGKFTDIALEASTGFSVTAGKPLAVRIAKSGGAGTYLDFDQVRLTSALTPYTAWADSFPGLTDKTPAGDPDGDGIKNLLEYVIGGDPQVSSTGFLPKQNIVGTDLVLTYKRNDISETDTTQTGQWSTDLEAWTNIAPVLVSENGTDPDDMKIVIPMANAVNGKLFGRFKVSQT